MSNEINLLEDFEYLGEFWFFKNRSNKFSGVLKYSASRGIKIKFISTSKTTSINLCVEKDLVLLGCVKDLGNITLFPSFLSKHSTIFGNSKSISISESGAIDCRLAIVGLHYTKKTDLEFKSCSFKFNDIENFCSRNPMLENCNENSSILKASYDNFNLDLEQIVHYTYGGNKMSDLLFLKDSKAQQDLDKAVNGVMKNHDLKSLDQKTKVSYEFYLQKKNKNICDKEDFLDFIFNIRNLFSCLMLKPLFPKQINFYKNKISYNVLYSNYLTESHLQSIKATTHFFNLPININDIKDSFQDAVTYWIDFEKWKLNLLDEAIFNHLFREIDPISHYVVLIASIERWQIEVSQDETKNCYSNFIEKYANQQIKEKLLEILPKEIKVNEIGKALKDIRDIIEHPQIITRGKNGEKKFKKFKEYISRKNIANLAEKLFILFIIALYKEFKLPISSIDRTRKKFPKGIRTWE